MPLFISSADKMINFTTRPASIDWERYAKKNIPELQKMPSTYKNHRIGLVNILLIKYLNEINIKAWVVNYFLICTLKEYKFHV